MSQLFRQEAVNALSQSAYGEVRIGTPGPLLACSLALIVLVLACLSWLGASDYSRKHMVLGSIDDLETTAIVTRALGELRELVVVEGQPVEKGDYLGKVVSVSPATVTAVNADTRQQIETLRELAINNLGSFNTKHHQISLARNQSQQLAHLADQDVTLQKKKVAHLVNQAKAIRRMREQGYLSELDWHNARLQLLSEQQRLNQLRQKALGYHRARSDLGAELAVITSNYEKENAELELSLARLNQQIREQQQQYSQELIAPFSGQVTRLAVQTGMTLMPGEPIMHISTGAPALTASLQVPTHAAGYLAVGTTLELEVDAFPASLHGRLSATVTHLSDHVIAETNSYLARLNIHAASLERTDAGRYLPGMSLRTFVRSESKTLFEWLTAPVLQLSDQL